MKKIYTLISVFLISSSGVMAQATPNGGFESWTTIPASPPAPAYDDPNGWNTLNSLTSAAGAITCTKATAGADVHSGSSAIKLTTKSVFGQVANGLITTGVPHASPPSVDGGIAYTLKPDSIIGWYKYAPVNVDKGFVEIQLLGAGGNTDTVGYAIFRTPNAVVSAYTRFAVKINYRNNNPVAKSIWILSSSHNNSIHYANSIMYVDDLQLGSDAWQLTGVNEIATSGLTVGPNPTSHQLTIKNPTSEKIFFVLYDVTGRIVVQEKINTTIVTVDIEDLPAGMYIYSVTDANGTIVKTDKIFIEK